MPPLLSAGCCTDIMAGKSEEKVRDMHAKHHKLVMSVAPQSWPWAQSLPLSVVSLGVAWRSQPHLVHGAYSS